VSAANATPPTQTTLASGAQRVELHLDSAASVAAVGWQRENHNGMSRFRGGVLELHAQGMETWRLARGFEQATNGPGWAVEARLAIAHGCARGGTGIWIGDGIRDVHLAIGDQAVALEGGPSAAIGATTALHIYRVELAGDTLTVRVDGKPVLTTPAKTGEYPHSPELRFGVLGNACTGDASTWDYVAYETTPAHVLAWPPPEDWNAGTSASQLLDALRATLPSVVPAARLDPAMTPCLALVTLDALARDLVPVLYDATPMRTAGDDLRGMDPLRQKMDYEIVVRQIEAKHAQRRQPMCDPIPHGPPCGPRQPDPAPPPFPPGVVLARTALVDAARWGIHPAIAVRATRNAAQVYADAVAAKIPGAAAARGRLAARLARLARMPQECGLVRRN
jgi:hypothetical protein